METDIEDFLFFQYFFNRQVSLVCSPGIWCEICLSYQGFEGLMALLATRFWLDMLTEGQPLCNRGFSET